MSGQIVSSIILVLTGYFGVNEEDISTSCTILVAIVGFMILYQIAKPMTAGHRVLMVGMVAGWLFCMIFVSHLFAIRDISGCRNVLFVHTKYLTKQYQTAESKKIGKSGRQCLQQHICHKMSLYAVFVWL